jgi:signal transduction histidine kinase
MNYWEFFTDITDQRKAEKEIKRFRSILSKEENFKTVFLKNLSHEIRTPMNAILGFSELLGLPDISPETVKNYTSIIRDKGQYLLGFMDDVIELSKFESDNIAFNKSEFELIPLLNELFDEFDKRRIERGKDSIKLMLKIPKGMENLKIYTDPGRLQQILGNLLSNALKFTEKGTVEFGFLETARNYKFYVKDTGIGLSEEDQKKNISSI